MASTRDVEPDDRENIKTFKIHASRAALGLAHVSTPTSLRSLTPRLAALPLVHNLGVHARGVAGCICPKWCGSLPPVPLAARCDELGWPIGPEGNEEGAKPAAGAAREATSEVLTGPEARQQRKAGTRA